MNRLEFVTTIDFSFIKKCSKEDDYYQCSNCEFKKHCKYVTCYGKRKTCKGCGNLQNCDRVEAINEKRIIGDY